ncbi:MAG: fructosamine kinase family protein [Gammaproteobacteria bacterium]|nr:fructosamine kinase family protein [Gammaproteobacteria bacterium]
MDAWNTIARRVAEASGEPFDPMAPETLAGGCINSAFRLGDGKRTYFVKTNRAALLDMFEAEAAGLEALADSHTLRVPRPVCTGTCEGLSFIVMEYLAPGRGSHRGWQLAGERLAAMHRVSSTHFGWSRDNTIGATPQTNTPNGDWIAFWREQRLGFQLELAARKGYGGRLQVLGSRLQERCPALLEHAPTASLLHGDLWGGNLGFTDDGQPMIYDPAVYFGDREADIAMTELFGGFDSAFYAAYRASWPLDAGYPVRKQLYNLYHVLNHLNLFGGSYQGQAERMMQALLAEC